MILAAGILAVLLCPASIWAADETGPTPTPCPFVGPCVKAVTLEITCSSPVNESTGELLLVISRPLDLLKPCEAAACNPILSCQIPCGLLQAPTCSFSVDILAEQIKACLNPQGSGNLCVTSGDSAGELRIEANFPFDLCFESTEFGLASGEGYLLLPECPLANLCDGNNGNEREDPENGLTLVVESASCGPCPCYEAASLIFACTPGILFPTCTFRLSAAQAAWPGKSECEPVACASAIASCTVNLFDLVQGTKSDDGVCPTVTALLASHFVRCLEPQLSGLVCMTTEAIGQISIRSSIPLQWCVCGEEIPECEADLGLPLSEHCSVVNLCDGTRGNESGAFFDWTSGMAIYYEPRPCEETEFTPTPSPSATATHSATPIATSTPTPSATASASPTASGTPLGCDSGYYILDSFGSLHRAGNPEIIQSSLLYGEKLAKDMEQAFLAQYPDSPSHGLDLVALDGFGSAHYLAHPVSISQDFLFQGLPEFPLGRALDIEVTQDGLGFWVLTDFGGIYRAGSAKDQNEPGLVPGTDRTGVLGMDVLYGSMRDPSLPNPGGASLRAVALAVIDTNLDSRAEGYLVVDSQGGRFQYNANGTPVAPGTHANTPSNSPLRLLDPSAYVWPFFPGLDIARDCELHPTQQGVVVYDGWGGVHPVPVNEPANPVFFARNEDPNSPGVLLTTVGLPYIVAGFDDPDTVVNEADSEGWGLDAGSVFKDLEFCRAGQAGLYVMDRYGGVFTFGAARGNPASLEPPFAGSPYFFPEMVAEDLEPFSFEQAEKDP
jgi:hypothetical protein